MGREYNLYTNLVQVKAGDREDLLNALKDLSYFDCDFIGENGTEYAWEETLEAGFESNLDYLLDKVKNIENDVECVKEFVDTWMGNDSGYYAQYELNYLTDDKGNVFAVSLSAMTGY